MVSVVQSDGDERITDDVVSFSINAFLFFPVQSIFCLVQKLFIDAQEIITMPRGTDGLMLLFGLLEEEGTLV